MVRNYQKKKEVRWNEEDMKQAVKDVQKNQRSIRNAAEKYGVSKTSLLKRLKIIQAGGIVNFAPKQGSYETIFNEKQEKAFVEHILYMQKVSKSYKLVHFLSVLIFLEIKFEL